METIVFDTLAYTKKLVSAVFTQQQAEVQAEALAKFVKEQLVSKQYFDLRLSQTKECIMKWVGAMLETQAAILATLVKIL